MSEHESRLCAWCEAELQDDWETARQHIAGCLDAKRGGKPMPPHLTADDRCSRCGLGFPGGSRNFKTYGTPVVSFETHAQTCGQPVGDRWERHPLWAGAHPVHYGSNGEILTPTLPVRPDKLARHVNLYGREGTDQWYGGRNRTELSRTAKRLRKQGLVPAAIADRLGISDRRVKKFLKAA
jgi:hypothetical protein